MNELKWAWAYHHADEKNSESFKNFLLLAFGVLLLKAPHSRSTLPTLIHSLLNMQIARQEMIHTFVSRENSILFLIDWWHQQTTASYLLVEKVKDEENDVKLFCWLRFEFPALWAVREWKTWEIKWKFLNQSNFSLLLMFSTLWFDIFYFSHIALSSFRFLLFFNFIIRVNLRFAHQLSKKIERILTSPQAPTTLFFTKVKTVRT